MQTLMAAGWLDAAGRRPLEVLRLGAEALRRAATPQHLLEPRFFPELAIGVSRARTVCAR